MKSSRATVSIAARSRSEQRSPRRPSSPIFASLSRLRSSSLLSGRLGGGMTHPFIGPRKRRARANPPASRSDAWPPGKSHHPAGDACHNPPGPPASPSSGRGWRERGRAIGLRDRAALGHQQCEAAAKETRLGAQPSPAPSAWPRSGEPPARDVSPRTSSSEIVAFAPRRGPRARRIYGPSGILIAREPSPRARWLGCRAGGPAVAGPTPSRPARRNAERLPPGCRCFRARRPS